MANEATTKDTNRLRIYWEDHHNEAEAEILPKEMQEPFLWLKRYVRDNCNRDLDVLLEKARVLGITTDKTTFSRVFRRQWKWDKDGVEVISPIISITNFLRNVTALRENMRIELLQGRMPFVETSIFHAIKNYIDKKKRPDRVNAFGVIYGPTGLQKTATFKELERRDTNIKLIQASDNGSMKEFVCNLAIKYGAGRHISFGPAKRVIEDNFCAGKVIIVDNTQDMVRSDKALQAMGKKTDHQPFYQFMRRIQDERGGTIIESFTPESEEQIFNKNSVYLEQFEGRVGGKGGVLRLPNRNPKADLVAIAEALGLQNAARHADKLAEIEANRGRIRTFFEVLQEAKDAAEDAGDRLSWDYIEAAAEERSETKGK